MKRTKKEKRRLRIYIFSIIILIGIFIYKMNYYWPKIFNNYQEKQELENNFQTLLETEETLSSDIVRLKDPEYIARFAREKYLYSKDGEIIIRIVE